MFKKHYRLILIVLLLVITPAFFFGIEWHGAYAACRNKMLFMNNEPWVYERTDFSPVNYYPFDLQFHSETAGVSCHVRHNGPKWDVMLYWTSSLP